MGLEPSDPAELLWPFGDLEFIISKNLTASPGVLKSLPQFAVRIGGPTIGEFKVSKGIRVLKPDILLLLL